jgi:hypothetical protein
MTAAHLLPEIMATVHNCISFFYEVKTWYGDIEDQTEK